MSDATRRERSVKDKLKAKRLVTGIDYNVLMKKYFIDGFLELLAKSTSGSKFVWKGGFVMSAIAGVEERTTVDLDTMLRGVTVNILTVTEIMNDVVSKVSSDGCRYSLVSIERIQEQKAYHGFRVFLQGELGQMRDNFHLDIATGEKLDPSAISFSYQPLIGIEKIPIQIYRPERILAEKLETILARGLANTRMKDFYDVYVIARLISIDGTVLNHAFEVVVDERSSNEIFHEWKSTLDSLRGDRRMLRLWENYTTRNSFAENIEFSDTLDSVVKYLTEIRL